MSVKFAGARSVDGRRRRRIVSENEQGTPGKGPVSASAGYLKLRRVEPDAEEPARAPIASLIPHRAWQIWLYCVGIPVLAMLLHTACLLLSDTQRAAVAEIVDWQEGHIWRFLRGLTLLGCAGLCWLISWFRSASVRDFEGCFKSWYWSGWILALVGLAAGTDAHLVAGAALKDAMQLQIGNFVTLAWLIPLLSLLIEPVRCFTREMWHSRRSWTAFWACCLSGLLYCWARLQGPHTDGLMSEAALQVTASAASVLTPMLLLSALLSQVHYVMYISSDPVPRRYSYVVQGIGVTVRRLLACTGQVGVHLGAMMGRLRTGWRDGADERAARKAERREAAAKRREEQREKRKSSSETEQSEKAAARQARKEQLAREKAEKLAEKQAAKQKAADEKAAQNLAAKQAAEEKAAQKLAAKQEAEEKAAAAKAARDAEAARKAAEQEAAREAKQQARKTRSRRKPAAVETSDDVAKANEVAAEANQPAAKAPEPAEKAKPKPRIRVKSQQAAATKEPAAEPAAPQQTPAAKSVETSPTTASVSFEEAAAAVAEMAEDGESDVIDPALLKGLSKKEKRKLRKMHREQSRRKAG